MRPFIRVKVLATGHQVDIHRSHFDPVRHRLAKGWPDSWVPRRSKFAVKFPPVRVGAGVPVSLTVGTEDKESST